LRLLGANPRAEVAGLDELPGNSNYFIGKDPKKWHTHVPTYGRVRYQNIYPGVDLVYHGGQNGQLEYDFVLAPGADPNAIQLAIAGPGLEESWQKAADSRQKAAPNHTPHFGQSKIPKRKSKIASPLRIASNGGLIVPLAGGDLRLDKPVVYQVPSPAESREPTVQSRRRTTDDGQRTSSNLKSKIPNQRLVDAHYILKPGGVVTFEIAPYDNTLPLIIDPVLTYSTYLGGSDMDYANGIAVDASGSAYVTGYTASVDFPVTDAAQSSPGGGSCLEDGVATPCFDAFISKLNPSGTALVYSTYLGGSDEDYGASIAVDSSGDAYVAGYTYSADFPMQNALQPNNAGGVDAFVAELSPNGASLIYSTYWGGSLDDVGTGIAVDSKGNAYLSGYTESTNFPVTSGAFQTTYGNGAHNGFVVKFNSGGAQIGYSTYLGGSGDDYAYAGAVDSAGDAYVTGATNSTNFPTLNALQPNYAGGQCAVAPNTFPCFDVFVSKINSAGSALLFSTYLGGTGSDYGYAIALDSSANAYLTGYTTSNNFPTTPAAFDRVFSGACDVFVAKLSSSGSTLAYSTYLGGSGGTQVAYGIAVDSNGSAYLTGYNYGGNFPTVNPEQAQNAAFYDAFVSVLDPTGRFLVFSTYLGGTQDDFGRGIALDPSANVYVAGATFSPDFPTTSGSFEPAYMGGPYDAFVTAYSAPAVPVVAISPASYNFGNQPVGTASSPETISLTNNGYVALTISSIIASGDFSQTNNCGSGLATSASCTISVIFTPSVTGPRSGAITITDNASPPTQTVSLTGTGAGAQANLSPASLTFSAQLVGTSSSPQSLTLSNPGSTTLTISSIAVSGDFSQTNTCGSNLSANASCTISVTFKPTATGSRTGSLTVTDNANPTTQTVSLSGTGTAPAASLSPASLTFPPQLVGTSSSPQILTLTNTGSATLTITSITASGAFSQTNTCGSSLASNGTCTISVTFKPTTSGTLTGILTVTDNASPSTQTASLSGTGVAAPVVSLSPTSLTFSLRMVGTSSAAQTVTLKNTGKGSLTISSITVSGDFSQTNTCGSSVAAGASCTIKVTFKPTALGTRTGVLTCTDNASPTTQTVKLTGTGEGPVVSLSPTSLTFASQTVGTSSSPQRVTLKNTGNVALSITSIKISGEFSETSTCTSSLAVNATCTVSVTFKPTAAGTTTGTLTFTDNAYPTTQTVSLTGTGASSTSVKIVPASLTFAAQTVGTVSSPQSVTLTNTGGAALSIVGVTASAEASQTNDCGSSVAVNASCTLSVTFNPAAGGTRTAAIAVTDTAEGSPQTIALTGTGEDFTIAAPSGSSTSATVSPGGAATYSLSAMALGGFNQTVAFACTGAPTGASCAVSPVSTSFTGPATLTVSIVTAAASGLPPHIPIAPPLLPQPWLLWTMGLLASGSLAGAVRKRDTSGERGRAATTAFAALVLVMLALAACGGGGGATAPQPAISGTPAGTYSLTITGTCTSCSTALSHFVGLTLTVQ
jgi:hypothetical protein